MKFIAYVSWNLYKDFQIIVEGGRYVVEAATLGEARNIVLDQLNKSFPPGARPIAEDPFRSNPRLDYIEDEEENRYPGGFAK